MQAPVSNPTIRVCEREKKMENHTRSLLPWLPAPGPSCQYPFPISLSCCQSTIRDWSHSSMGQGGQAHIFSSPRWRCGGARDGYKCRFVGKTTRILGCRACLTSSAIRPGPSPSSASSMLLSLVRHVRCIYLQGRLPAPTQTCLMEPSLYARSACAYNLY